MEKGHFPPMHYALIAAGEGSRLKEEGITVPKPLVKIQGLPMIERLIGIFMRNGARSISVICNEQMTEVQDFLSSLNGSSLLKSVDESGTEYSCQLNVVVQTTPSSMHSLAALSTVIPEGRFCLTTVDTIFLESEFASFIQAFAEMDETQKDGLFAVTPFVDDEKPLWVGINPKKTFSCACAKQASTSKQLSEVTSEIVGFYDQEGQMPDSVEKMVSGGIYCLNTRSAFPVLHNCLKQGQSRMRNFQRALIAEGLRLDAYIFPKIMDVDHASDVEKAEKWISQSQKRILCIARDEVYSPNNVEKDAAILHAVKSILLRRGWLVEECTEKEFVENCEFDCDSQFDRVFHMSRHQQSLLQLSRFSCPVLNRPASVCITAKSRSKTLSILDQQGVDVPSWISLSEESGKLTATDFLSSTFFPAWLKIMREDGVSASDVRYIEDLTSLQSEIMRIKADELVTDIVLMCHIEGELVKVYVVQGPADEKPRLVKWFRPQNIGYSKFGEAESHNFIVDSIQVNEEKITALSKAIGSALKINVFGFDMIVQPDGSMRVIDVNDWPSFSMCRDDAAEAIASVIEQL